MALFGQFIYTAMAVAFLYGILSRKVWSIQLGLFQQVLAVALLIYASFSLDELVTEGLAEVSAELPASVDQRQIEDLRPVIMNFYVTTIVLAVVYSIALAAVLFRNRNFFETQSSEDLEGSSSA